MKKDVLNGAEFQQITEIHESGEVGDPSRLLQIVSDNDDRMIALEVIDDLLDLLPIILGIFATAVVFAFVLDEAKTRIFRALDMR